MRDVCLGPENEWESTAVDSLTARALMLVLAEEPDSALGAEVAAEIDRLGVPYTAGNLTEIEAATRSRDGKVRAQSWRAHDAAVANLATALAERRAA